MIRNRISTLVSIGLFAAASILRAQENPIGESAREGRAASVDPFLDGLVLEALQKNPELTGVLSSAEAARFRIEPARTLPDPFLSFNYQNDGKSLSLGKEEMTFLGAMFSQPLPWPGKLRLAGEEANKRAEEVKEGTVGRALLSVEARVRRAYYDYLLAKAQLELIEDRSRSWREISDIVRERYAVGIGVQQDVLRAQIEVLRLDEARAEQTAQVATRRAEVNRVLGRPQETEIQTPARLTFRANLPDLPALLQAIRDRSPELAGASRAIEASRLRVSIAKKNLLPDFVASGGPMYRGGLDPMWQVGLGVTLPIYAGSRQRPLLASAQADVRTEEARASSTGQELEFRTRERFENLRAILRVIRLYDEGVLPVDQLSLESAIANYRTGKVPFITVLEALNSLYADRSIYLTRLAEAEKVRVAID
ncbi:MAG TPA: TolC family protein, partial [Thermoanaerobaculia bacterium]|nr:TolC family protein [Thermoanaerobaculia bacterium]